MTSLLIANPRARTALARCVPHEYELSGWPADVVEFCELFCRLYHFKPPITKKAKAFWIAALRESVDAAGEYGCKALIEQRRAFKAEMQKNMDAGRGGLAPFTVDSPKSIVNDVRGTAARMRENDYVDTEYSEDSPYTTGKYAGFIEH